MAPMPDWIYVFNFAATAQVFDLYRFGMKRTRSCKVDCGGRCVKNILNGTVFFPCECCHKRKSLWQGTEWSGCNLTYSQCWYCLITFVIQKNDNITCLLWVSPQTCSAFRMKAQKICEQIMGKPENAIGDENVIVQVDEAYFMKPGARRPYKCPTKRKA